MSPKSTTPALERLAAIEALPDDAMVPVGYVRELLANRTAPVDMTRLTCEMWARRATEHLSPRPELVR